VRHVPEQLVDGGGVSGLERPIGQTVLYLYGCIVSPRYFDAHRSEQAVHRAGRHIVQAFLVRDHLD
jgi:hypothetical protein